MDLVEIRKKAKSRKKKPARKEEATSVEPSVQEEQGQADSEEISPEEPVIKPTPDKEEASFHVEEPREEVPVEEEKPVTAADPGETSSPEEDPLDALFSFQHDSDLATTDNYLQALVAEDDLADSNTEQWLTFALGKEEYALSIESVSEIIKPREVTDIPRVPEFISGIISLRGIIVPVFDLNRRLNLGSAELGSAARIIVCQDEERLAGFIVDSINQVVNVPIGNIEPPPTVLSGLDRDFVEGVGRVDNRMLILLHLSNVINAELV